MSQVMSRPGRQQLRQRNHPKRRMSSTQLEVLSPQIQCTQLNQVLQPQTSELIQQLPQRLTFTLSYLSPAIEGLKRPALAELQNHPRPRHPVRAFAVNQMAHNIEHAPRALTFIPRRPRLRQIPQ